VDFVERLQRRQQLWWKARASLTDPRSLPRALHARRDITRRLAADDPDSAWRCCAAWPRKLINKWNGREFCNRYDVDLPVLYAFAESPAQIAFDSLPGRYVIRPVFGRRRRGTLVIDDGLDLLTREPFSSDAVHAYLSKQRGAAGRPWLLEEVIDREDGSGRLPIEYKCHTFGATVAAIQRTERVDGNEGGSTTRYYRPDWGEWDDVMDRALPQGPAADPPPFLAELIETSIRLGQLIGTYMRVDFFGSERGLVFNEFSSTPAVVRPMFSPYCSALFGRMWDDAFPDAI
jgi:hypothetical protein